MSDKRIGKASTAAGRNKQPARSTSSTVPALEPFGGGPLRLGFCPAVYLAHNSKAQLSPPTSRAPAESH